MTNEQSMSPEPSNDESSPATLAPQVADLFLADPLSLTETDLTFLAQYYQTKRLQFAIAEKKPKAVRVSRGPKLDKTESKSRLDGLLKGMIGQHKAAQTLSPPTATTIEDDAPIVVESGPSFVSGDDDD